MLILVFLLSLLGALAIGIPIAFALLFSGVILMFFLGFSDSVLIASNLINGADNYPLLAVPLFILAGELMNAGGLSQRIVSMAMSIFGHVKGGLGYVAILSTLLFASLSGSPVADTAAIAAILIPMMVSRGYDINRSSGLIAAGGITAAIIPPSIGFIIFGVTAGISITQLFLAGIIPGLIMGLGLIAMWSIIARKDKVVVEQRQPLKKIFSEILNAFWALLLPVIILVGLRGGVFTPTEAGVVAAVYTLFVGVVIYRELKLKQLYEVFVRAAKTSSIVMFLVAAALVTSWFIAAGNLPSHIMGFLDPVMDNPTLLVLVMVLIILVVGMVMDMTPIILILVPVFFPIVEAVGIDPIYFGVVFIMATAIGLITPPVGNVLNVVAGIAKIEMEDVVKGIWPFLLIEVIVLFLLVFFPSLILVPLSWFY
jgi:tripartite ATP-independent transporter DctM subunit